MRKVVVAVDGSSGSADVLQWAVQNLPLQDPANKLVLLHVVKPLIRVITPVGYVPIDLVDKKVVVRLNSVAHEEAESMLQELAGQFQGVATELCVLEGDRRKRIVSGLERLGATDLVLGSKGGNIFTRLRGSISEYCFKHASCPVHIVRQGKLFRSSAKEPNLAELGATSSSTASEAKPSHLRRRSTGNPGDRPGPSLASLPSYNRRSFSVSDIKLPPLPESEPAKAYHSGPLQEGPPEDAVFSSGSTTTNWGAETPKGPLESTYVHHVQAKGAEQRLELELPDREDPLVDLSSDEDEESPEEETPSLVPDRILAKPSKVFGQEIRASTATTVSTVAALLLESRKPSSRFGSWKWGSKKDRLDSTSRGLLEGPSGGLSPWPSGPVGTADLPESEDNAGIYEPAKLARSATSIAPMLQGPKTAEIELLKRRLLEAELKAQRAKKEAEEEARRRQKAEEAAGLAWQWAEEESARRVEAAEKSRQAEAAAEEARKKWEEEATRRRAAMVALAAAQPQYRQFVYAELQQATEGFAAKNLIGEGGFGKVYKGKLQHLDVAVKVLNKDGMQGALELESEVAVLGRIRHPHVVTLLGCCLAEGCLVYEYLPGGNLDDRLKRKKGLPALMWFERFRIAAEVATAVLALHCSRPEAIVHRDLKPANILLDQHAVSKVADVGLAKLVPALETSLVEDSGPQVGTMAYVDPEYMRTGCFGPKSDVYALGIILLQLLTAKPGMGVVLEVEDALEAGPSKLKDLLDPTAGDWPWEDTCEIACLAMRCAEMRRRDRPDLETEVLLVLERARSRALEAQDTRRVSPRQPRPDRRPVVPSAFLCPITLEVMEDPVVCSDGHVYERKALEAWLQKNDISPALGSPLVSKQLEPNVELRTNILTWKIATSSTQGSPTISKPE